MWMWIKNETHWNEEEPEYLFYKNRIACSKRGCFTIFLKYVFVFKNEIEKYYGYIMNAKISGFVIE